MTRPQAILTDIEGTTSSISFVKDVLFPYARRAMPAYVREHGNHPQVRHWLNQVADEIGEDVPDEVLITTLQTWIDEDRKHTALKALQGLIWGDGYKTADFTAHIYADAAIQLKAWHAAGIPLYVYSSGSVPAQKLFFAHSDAGDLSGLITDWFDTEVGPKRESASYRRIAERTGVPGPEILFLSDVIEELDAAKRAGMRTALLDRREDYPTPRSADDVGSHQRVESFSQLVL
ncbi:acireductone synthase [Xanthomonas euvesicatoria pv. physalidis]|uniref:acireductone synthase n=1 Tax=Xanthomonas euvesicatoria TaxID=456327 RepID=UPI001C43AE0F|nr:acireductone synthase [Xanthomonas euvesicatoria]MBV6689803.1 acireductone synthase [Xanthomonas euvesicatoria pv. physalidis]